MTKLLWDQSGTRYFETGLDRGVLFVGTQAGVAWSGLISVAESPSGGEAKPYYIDGYKYLNIAAAEEFEATITAFSAPMEFAPCDGRALLSNGLIATQQPRKPFNFSYRTKVGNDVDGADHGYKIHIVYNALAAPTQNTYTTMGDNAEATQMAWAITTLPPKMTGLKPTAHFAIDTRYSSAAFLQTIENILYGTVSDQPRLPSVVELIELSNNYPSARLAVRGPGVYEIEGSTLSEANTYIQDQAPVVATDSLWLDSNNEGYLVPRLVTGG